MVCTILFLYGLVTRGSKEGKHLSRLVWHGDGAIFSVIYSACKTTIHFASGHATGPYLSKAASPSYTARFLSYGFSLGDGIRHCT